ncbi:MAG: AAA family ATPase [Planctomycetes bacterium]|nr:AAA family ATPase [Planctomycetota bacterium]
MSNPPQLVVLAGPNGAGKSTSAAALLETLGITEFVNADTIARGLSSANPEQVAISAGRIMLRRLKELADQRADFAFETTLASRSFAPWISQLVQTGYNFQLVFLWLSSADQAVGRVAQRSKMGGHSVPEQTVRRRYRAGLKNFVKTYRPLATHWRMYDNSGLHKPRLVAVGAGSDTTDVLDSRVWNQIASTFDER